VFYGPPPAPKSIRRMKRTFDGSLSLPTTVQSTTTASSTSSTSSTSSGTTTNSTSHFSGAFLDLWIEPVFSPQPKTHQNILFSVLTESRVIRRGAYLPIVAPRKEDHETFFGKQRKWSWTGAARKSIRRDILKSSDCEVLSQEEKNSWYITDDPQHALGNLVVSIVFCSILIFDGKEQQFILLRYHLTQRQQRQSCSTRFACKTGMTPTKITRQNCLIAIRFSERKRCCFSQLR